MRIRPVILDSAPGYLCSSGCSESLLLVPLGAHTVIQHLQAWLEPITIHAPLIVSRDGWSSDCRERIQAALPSAVVVSTPEEAANAIGSYELSDALLIIDPRYLPFRANELTRLVYEYSAEPRVSHHLVDFEAAVAGTKERVSFDGAGQVRAILRHYQPTTWPFIAGIAATLLPAASGVLSDGRIPSSLLDLRQTLAALGVPSRDLPAQGGALDLTHEVGLLAANEHFVRSAVSLYRDSASAMGPLRIGGGHSIHETARITGAVVIHPDVRIERNAVVLGPVMIGAGARISAGAVVTHAVIGPSAIVPEGGVVRQSVWFNNSASTRECRAEPLAYSERLARLLTEARPDEADAYQSLLSSNMRAGNLIKRAVDVCVAALALIASSPLLALAALAVRLESKGPIFYGDKREGLGGRVFRCWKFRTMQVNAHAVQNQLKAIDKMDGPHFKLDRDPRVTRVGRVLRALNLDELPQLFNVLRGEMSLVGPRPSPFRENQVCVPWREARLSVRPGITGFWQVCRHDRSAGDFHQWIEYDLLYVQHMSVWLDLKIAAATLLTLGGKLRHIPSSWLVASAAVEWQAKPTRRQPVHSSTRNGQVVPT